MCMNLSDILHYVCAGTHGGQKRVSDLWELECQAAVRGHAIAGNQTWALCTSSKYS